MPRIVIVGAGPAGINAMQTLANALKPSDDVEIVIIEKSAFYYHTIGASRAFTDASYAKNMFIPYDHVIPTKAQRFVRFVRAIVTKISTTLVTYKAIDRSDQLDELELNLAFDYLILATGSTYTVPIKQDASTFARAHTEAKIQEVRGQITKAQRILVVGGGAVGCEVAADIAAHYPTKQVTLLEGRDQLVASDNVKDSLRTKLRASIKALGVRVILGERLEQRLTGNSFEPRTLRTDKGTVIDTDIQLLCAGFHPSSQLVQALDASLIDTRGAIRVTDTCQLDGPAYKHMFALGDVTNHATPKMAYYAGEQAKHLANELVAVVRGSQSQVTKPFPPVAVQALIVPLGPNGGVTQLPLFGGWVLGDWTTRMLKAKDMGASMAWSSLGAKPPQ